MQTERRGKDATGYWGTEKGEGKIVYHKEPTAPTCFVDKPAWTELANFNLDMLLAHARKASTGVGLPSVNRNNHPFVSNCRSVGLVHNGCILDQEYCALRKKYEVLSQCDSEILLRIFEAGNTYDEKEVSQEFDEPGELAFKLMGIRDIWSTITEGHMAVAIGERLGGLHRLWLFRNVFRSLWLVDMREALGQVFFASTPEIWNDAVRECQVVWPLFNQYRIKQVELPVEEVWILKTENGCVDEPDRFEVAPKGDYFPWEYKGEKLRIQRQERLAEIFTSLNENDEITNNQHNSMSLPFYDASDDMSIVPLVDLCNEIQETTSEIEGYVNRHSNFSLREYDELTESLRQINLDLQGTLRMLGY